jgi:hypothetical protein
MTFFETPYTTNKEKVMLLGESARPAYHSGGMASVPERLVRCIWYDQFLDKTRLRTSDDRRIDIYSQGEWNSGPGPDFSDALFRIDGEDTIRGDIELHVCADDWRRHGHHKNPAYSDVALHVALWDDGKEPFITNARGEAIPQIILADCLTEDLASLASRIDMENYPFCSEERVGLCKQEIDKAPDRLRQLLEMAGRERLFNKTQKLQRELRRRSFDETLYRGLMEGLGYRHNKAPFRKLAEIVPLSAVREIVRESPRLDHPLIMQSLYFGASGLFSNIEVNLWDAETHAYCETIMQTWEKYKSVLGPVRLHKKDWTLAGVRPANFPLRRMAGLSFLMGGRFESGIGDAAAKFGDTVKSCGDIKQIKRELDNFSKLFCCEGYGYWAHHIVPGGKRLDAVPSLIGEPLAHAIALNTTVPLLLARAAQREDTLLRDRLLDLYAIFPSLDKHRITKLMQHRLWGADGGAGKILTREINQQGLLQVFNDFCDENIQNCVECPFPKMLDFSGSIIG